MVDENGNVVESYDYFPFGLTARSAGTGTKYKFTQKELDNETDFYYFGARYYDQRVGRFISPDPLAEKHPGWTPYHYTLDNPLRFIDPDGKQVDAVKFAVAITEAIQSFSESLEERLNLTLTTGSPLNPMEEYVVSSIKEGFSNPQRVAYATADVVGDMSSKISIGTAALGIFPSPASPYLFAVSRTAGTIGLTMDAVKVALAPDWETQKRDVLKFGFGATMFLGAKGLIDLNRISSGMDIPAESFIQFTTGSISFTGGKIISGNKRIFMTRTELTTIGHQISCVDGTVVHRPNKYGMKYIPNKLFKFNY